MHCSRHRHAGRLCQRQQTFYKITKLIYDKVYWLATGGSGHLGRRLQAENVKISGATPFFNIIEWTDPVA